MSNTDPKIIKSPLCKRVTSDGITIDVEIYRIEGQDGWAMELVEEDGSATTWDELFTSDMEAWSFFEEGVAQIGLTAFLQPDEDEEEPTIH